jgi:hypothetical protein
VSWDGDRRRRGSAGGACERSRQRRSTKGKGRALESDVDVLADEESRRGLDMNGSFCFIIILLFIFHYF